MEITVKDKDNNIVLHITADYNKYCYTYNQFIQRLKNAITNFLQKEKKYFSHKDEFTFYDLHNMLKRPKAILTLKLEECIEAEGIKNIKTQIFFLDEITADFDMNLRRKT